MYDTWIKSSTEQKDYDQLDAAAALEYALEGKADSLQSAYDADLKKFEDATTIFDENKTKFSDFESEYMEACALNTAKELHSSYKKWVDAEAKIKVDLQKDVDGFRFRAPSEPYSGFESKLKTYDPDPEGGSDFARSKFGSLSGKDLNTYAKQIGISIMAYNKKTENDDKPFSDKSDSLVEEFNTMIQEDCQKGIDEAKKAEEKQLEDYEKERTRLENLDTKAETLYTDANTACDVARTALNVAAAAF